MIHFARVPRFETIVLFMSKAEKEDVNEIWRVVGEGDEDRDQRKIWGLKW